MLLVGIVLFLARPPAAVDLNEALELTVHGILGCT